jgi:catechol 2,3-dioxygenase
MDSFAPSMRPEPRNPVTTQLAPRHAPTLEAEQPPPGVPRPLLHHVQLKTRRMDEMIRWYSDVLGLVISYRGETGAWLTNDDANHRLALLSYPKLKDDPEKVEHVGLHHTAWEYESLDDLLSTYARLRDADELPHRTVNHGPTTSFYYSDPDGNSVELQVDNFGDWRESVRFFRTPAFAADPFGPGVDPEALLEQRARGVDSGELVRRSYAGEFPVTRTNDRRIPL